MTSQTNTHAWRFFRAGGFDQVQIQSGADLLNLAALDQKLWAALACPTRGIEFDPQTLDLIDTDHDGRIRVPEILAATKWACGVLRSPDDLVTGGDSLNLSAINDATEEGRNLLASARQILLNLGKGDATAISVAEATDTVKIFAQTRFNGDGVIPADAADTEDVRAMIQDIITCLGAETDRSGKPGISQAKADAFFKDAEDFAGWNAKSAAEAATLMPLGDRTAAAHAAFSAVRKKVEDFFTRCRLVAFDERAAAALNRQESEYLELAARDLSISAEEVAGFPIARIAAGQALSLKDGINPAWEAAVRRLLNDAVVPLLGERSTLTAADWQTLSAKLAPYDAWLASKAGISVEKLGLPRVKEILAGNSRGAISELIARDKALEAEANGITAVNRLVRFHRDLVRLLNNFVNFRDFYRRERRAVFQAGTLYLDGRACDLCVPVSDPARHAKLAGLSSTCLAYCDCSRPGAKMTIAAAFTDGDSDNLMVGRNGVFYDRQGRDWDATITKVIENPISVRQAFWAPYKKLVRLIEEQVAKRAAAADAASDKKLGAAANEATTLDKKQDAQDVGPRKIDVGTVAALGVAFGALLTAFAAIAGYASGLLRLPFWQVCIAVAGLLLLISGPSMLIAWLKLRRRNLGPILDANGWAINGRVRLSVPFGGSLTTVAKLPPGARAIANDPFAERPSIWPRIVLVLVLIGFALSLLNQFGLLHRITGIGTSQSDLQAAATPATTNAAPAATSAGGN